MAWTDDRVETLKKLWNDGFSASQIAAELGGVTRNAVIGKVHRLGLSGRAKSPSSTVRRVTKVRAQRSMSARKPKMATSIGNTALKIMPDILPDAQLAPIEELYIPPDQRASIITLTETKCKWPVGDPLSENFFFCGREHETDGPYCDFHARIAYNNHLNKKK